MDICKVECGYIFRENGEEAYNNYVGESRTTGTFRVHVEY
jgi:hypothetical protein